MSRDITLLRLHSTPGLGPQALIRILNWAQYSEAELTTIFELQTPELATLFNLKESVAKVLLASTIETGERLANELQARRFRLVARGDDAYPHAVLELLQEKAPPILYLHGLDEKLQESALAFSGSRHASEQGQRYTQELTAEAVQRGYAVVSGHAAGVDITAHRTAVKRGGTTVLVLPEGPLKFRLHLQLRELYSENASNFVIVSEFPPEMPWSAGNAMSRNRTILALSQALIVIEAGDSGGTFSACKEALKREVPVFVLDYPNPPESARGNQLLLQRGASPISVTPKATLPADFGKRLPPDKRTQLPLL